MKAHILSLLNFLFPIISLISLSMSSTIAPTAFEAYPMLLYAKPPHPKHLMPYLLKTASASGYFNTTSNMRVFSFITAITPNNIIPSWGSHMLHFIEYNVNNIYITPLYVA